MKFSLKLDIVAVQEIINKTERSDSPLKKVCCLLNPLEASFNVYLHLTDCRCDEF